MNTTSILHASLLLTAFAAASSFAQQITVCVEPAAAIPELAPATLVPLQADLPAGATVTALSVELELAHPWVGDLVITLGKDATQSTLLDRLSLGTFPFGCGGKNINAVFNDASTTTAESLCGPGPDPVLAGDVLPETPLAVFNGITAAGTWSLAVRDDQQFDLGTIDRVCLTISYSAPPCSAADVAEPTGLLDDADVSAFLGLVEAQDPSADLAAPFSQVDFFDVLTFLTLYDQGCP